MDMYAKHLYIRKHVHFSCHGMLVCMYACIFACMYAKARELSTPSFVYYMYICIYIYIYIYI
jgi:hypothetical protein